MKYSNKHGSILIWSIMLSVIVGISFISISSQIKKNLKQNGHYQKYLSEKSLINTLLDGKESKPLSNERVLILENNKERIFSLQQKETLQLYFSGTSDFGIDLGIITGGGIYYNYTNNISGVQSHSGVLNYQNSFSGELDNSNNRATLFFTNIGGYSEFLIKTTNNFETSQKKYKIVSNIGNHSVIETHGIH